MVIFSGIILLNAERRKAIYWTQTKGRQKGPQRQWLTYCRFDLEYLNGISTVVLTSRSSVPISQCEASRSRK